VLATGTEPDVGVTARARSTNPHGLAAAASSLERIGVEDAVLEVVREELPSASSRRFSAV
jgi:hypothetical protein